MNAPFTLRGPGPAAVLFLNEVVAALVAADPDVSEAATGAAVEAVASTSGLTRFDREQVLNAALDRLAAAGHRPIASRDDPEVPLDLHLRVVMLGALDAIAKDPTPTRRPF